MDKLICWSHILKRYPVKASNNWIFFQELWQLEISIQNPERLQQNRMICQRLPSRTCTWTHSYFLIYWSNQRNRKHVYHVSGQIMKTHSFQTEDWRVLWINKVNLHWKPLVVYTKSASCHTGRVYRKLNRHMEWMCTWQNYIA